MKKWVMIALIWAGAAQAETATLTNGDVLRGHFVQERHMQGFANPVRSEGEFVVAPGKGLIWKAETPFPVTTVVSSAGLVQSVGGSETMRLSAARLPFLSRLYDMMAGALAGNWRALESGFTVTRGANTVSLTPLDANAAQISAIHARLGRFVDQVDIVKPNGDFDRLTFRDQVLNARPLDESEAAVLK
jgi:Outer membrane lipoprotein carrier protein LolA-like